MTLSETFLICGCAENVLEPLKKEKGAQMLSRSLTSPHLEAGEEHRVFPLNQLLQRSEAERK